jgi:hypothetical protein
MASSEPHAVYANSGWSSWFDWLDNRGRRRARSWRPFKNARAFVQGLKLKNHKEWLVYAASGKSPMTFRPIHTAFMPMTAGRVGG